MTHFAYVSEVPVEDLYVSVDDLEGDELVVARRDARHEEQRRVPTVGNLVTYGDQSRVGRGSAWGQTASRAIVDGRRELILQGREETTKLISSPVPPPRVSTAQAGPL